MKISINRPSEFLKLTSAPLYNQRTLIDPKTLFYLVSTCSEAPLSSSPIHSGSNLPPAVAPASPLPPHATVLPLPDVCVKQKLSLYYHSRVF